MKVSVVSTLYYSAPYLLEFHRRVAEAVGPVTKDFEIVLVDDGSPDNSLQIAKELLKEKVKIKVVALSRNFGHHKAIMEGLSHASGDYIFLLDCDLEEPPEMFFQLYQKMTEASADDPIDLVQAVQDHRKGRIFERVTGYFFYQFFNIFSDVKIPPNSMMARLMTRRFVKAILAHEEREFFLSGLISLAGFRQEILVTRKTSKGATTYTLARKLTSTLNAITSFSDKLLFLIFYSGLIFSLIALSGIVFVLLSVILTGKHYLNGWASIILTITFFGGVSITSIGVVGLYLGRVFMEVKRRPYVVKELYTNE